MATGVAGKGAVVQLDNAAGSLTDISAFVESLDFSTEIETYLTTTLGSNSQSRVVGLKDGNFSVTFVYDRTGGVPTIYNHITGIYGAAASKSFDIRPEGSTSGYPKITGECNLKSFSLPIAVGDKLSITAQFEMTGDVTFGTV
jgi:hypothetical protein